MQEILPVLLPIAAVNILILSAIIFVIRRLILKDTARAIANIKQVEAEVRRKEEKIREQIAEHEREFEKTKAEAKAAIEKQRQDSEKELARLKEKIIADAKKEGEKIIDQAKKNEEKLRRQIAQDIEEKAVEYGGQIFKLVFSEEMSAELNGKFIDELLDALEEVDSSSITVETDKAEFRSSHPLDSQRKERLQNLLNKKFGANIQIKEKIDESLIAGLAFKLGSLEIDGSLLNRYHEAVAEVKKNFSI